MKTTYKDPSVRDSLFKLKYIHIMDTMQLGRKILLNQDKFIRIIQEAIKIQTLGLPLQFTESKESLAVQPGNQHFQ